MSERPRPLDFYSETPPARVIGTEMEYGSDLAFFVESDPSLATNPYLQALATLGIKASDHRYDWLSNGMRVYGDMLHFEVASAESLGPEDAAISDHAGLRFVTLIDKLVAEQLGVDMNHPNYEYPQRRSGVYGFGGDKEAKFTRVPDYFSKGYHENYLTPDLLDQRALNIMDCHLVSRGILFGSGMVGHTYTTSQKLQSTQRRTGFGTPTDEFEKPLSKIKTQKIPGLAHDDYPEWSLLEVRSGDPNMHPYLTYLTLATTSIVLRIIEHKEVFTTEQLARVSLDDPDGSGSNAGVESYGISDICKSSLELSDGRLVSQLDIQRSLCEMAATLSSFIELPEDEANAIWQWMSLIDSVDSAIREKDWASLSGKTEWATKLNWIHKRTGYDPSHIYRKSFPWTALAADYIWTQGRESPVGARILERELQNYKRFGAAITARMVSPPKNTRASVRGHYIQDETPGNGLIVNCWQAISRNQTFFALDPYATEI